MRRLALFLLFIMPVCAGAAHGARPAPALSPDQRIRHLLDRAGFGPRPGDVERVRAMGLSRYLEQQLHPETVPDDAADALVAGLPTLSMTAEDLVGGYRDAIQAGKASKAVAAPAALQSRRQARAFLADVTGELQMGKAIRAVESNRQLQEVMVDFWTNHFNVDIRKNADRAYKTVDDREVIRRFALGRFRDLLGASAKSPAMLVYLDNARSSAPAPAGARNGARAGLNENYARELMELHTLGVDGGYTQKDVQEVARCLTGWSVNPRTGGFQFYPRRHDDGEKIVLGHVIPANGGIQDGETVLDILAGHPSTAHFIALKLCRRFVADIPPKSVVNKAAATFKRTGGDIRQVVRAILTSPEFYAPASFRSKAKSPFEYAVSAVRALDGHFEAAADSGPRPQRGGARPFVAQVALLGEPLFQYQAPTGYPEVSAEWVGAGALVARLNFAVALAHGRITGVSIPAPAQAGAEQPVAKLLAGIQREILGGPAPATVNAALLKGAEAKPGAGIDRQALTALVLGSPEFQRR